MVQSTTVYKYKFTKMLNTKNLLSRTLLPIIKRVQTLSNHSEPPAKVEKSINQVILLGRVGGEPQKRGSDSHPVVIFSLATNSNYKYDTGDFAQKTEWHRICVFKPQLRESVYNYLKKGQRVHVSGRISYGDMKDEQGSVRSITSIIADDVIFFQTNQ